MCVLLHTLRQKLAKQFIERQPSIEEIDVPINQCVHFCGFRYGRNEYNPYETYLIDITKKLPIQEARRRFTEFLLYYRPRHLGEALGLDSGLRNYPLWIYPWQRFDQEAFTLQRGWCLTPNACPDILTHFCAEGIQSFRIDEEFVWLERTLHSVAKDGYQPERNGSFVTTLQLRRANKETSYLLLDGNHRVSAMSALGYTTVRAHQNAEQIITENDCDNWYGVRTGAFTREDALRIFNAYFDGNLQYRTLTIPAPILSPVAWKKLYLS